MLIHIVCWKYRNATSAETRSDHRKKLSALKHVIPGLDRFEVGEDILHLDRSYDTGLVAAFADRDALDAYVIHPEHQKVAELGKQIAESVVSVDLIAD